MGTPQHKKTMSRPMMRSGPKTVACTRYQLSRPSSPGHHRH
jgi:hypothetical protein